MFPQPPQHTPLRPSPSASPPVSGAGSTISSLSSKDDGGPLFLGPSVGAHPGEVLPTFGQAVTPLPGFVEKIDIDLVPLGAIHEAARQMAHLTTDTDDFKAAANLAARSDIAKRYAQATSFADIETVRKGPGVGRPQSVLRVTIQANHYDAVKAHLDNEYLYNVLDPEPDALSYIISYPNVVIIGEAINCIVMLVGPEIPLAIDRGKKGYDAIRVGCSHDVFLTRLAGKPISIGGTDCYIEEAPDAAPYGFLYGMGVPGMGEVRDNVLPAVKAAVFTHRLSLAEERQTQGG